MGNILSFSAPALVGICLAGTLVLAVVSAVTCACCRRRQVGETHSKLVTAKRGRGGSLQQAPCRKPSAADSPLHNKITFTSADNSSAATSPKGLSRSLEAHPKAEQNELVSTRVFTETETNNIISTKTSKKSEAKKKSLSSSGGTHKLGQLDFTLMYNSDKKILIVSIVKCRELPAKDPNSDSSDPYVKLQLLPDKQHKVKTRVLRKTRNPVYDEDFTFYGINPDQLQNTTLQFVVRSFDRYSRDDVIGEAFCSLAPLDMSRQLTLCRDIQPKGFKKSQDRGDLLVSLCWQPAANRLTVVVLKARNLPKMDVTGLADPYVKMNLICDGQRIAKKKTRVKKRTLNPVFNESFVFEIPSGSDSLDNVTLEFQVLDWDRVTKNEIVGKMELGANSTGSAEHHWGDVRNYPRRQIAEWHKLLK